MSTITNFGLETTARMIMGLSPAAAFTYIATGTGSAAESTADSALGVENTSLGAERAAATCTFSSPGTCQWSKNFVFSGNVTLREIGIFNAASGGNMFLRHVLSANKVYTDGESVEITITNTLSRI
jgi:hypothetical protein